MRWDGPCAAWLGMRRRRTRGRDVVHDGCARGRDCDCTGFSLYLYPHRRSLEVYGTTAVGINNEGQIVGSFNNNVTYLGFLYTDGVYTTISMPGSPVTEPLGINDARQIVGREKVLQVRGLSSTRMGSSPSSMFLAPSPPAPTASTMPGRLWGTTKPAWAVQSWVFS